MPRLAVLAFTLFLIGFLAGCGPSHEYSEGPPPGWEGEADRWWVPGTDTSTAFRNMESLRAMGVTDDSTPVVGRGVVVEGVKRGLLRLYRNQPEVIDSLFDRVVVPRIERAELTADTRADIERITQDSYRALGNNFQEPRATRRLGEDVHVVYPDSLREQDIGGRVRMQVFLNADGEPIAIQLLDSVHPVLDQIAMQATTEMRWRPAYVIQRGRWVELPSWARFNINFATGSS